MKDLTDAAPVRRMTVARGRLTAIPGDAPKADVGAVEAAVRLAVKSAPLVLPDAHPCQVGHVALDLAEEEGIVATVTVQAHARDVLEAHALYGVAVALLALRDRLGGGRIKDVHVVQNVD